MEHGNGVSCLDGKQEESWGLFETVCFITALYGIITIATILENDVNKVEPFFIVKFDAGPEGFEPTKKMGCEEYATTKILMLSIMKTICFLIINKIFSSNYTPKTPYRTFTKQNLTIF